MQKPRRFRSNPFIGGIIDRCVDIGIVRIGDPLTLKEYVARIETVNKSVILS